MMKLLLGIVLGLILFNCSINKKGSEKQLSEEEKNKVIMQLNNAGAAAYQFYLKPKSLNGAGRDFILVASNKIDWMPETDFYSKVLVKSESSKGPLVLIYKTKSGETISETITSDGSMRINIQ